MSEFAGKRYVVTRAASGIGHEVAEQLLAAGAEVYCLDRTTSTAAVTRHIEVDLANPRSIDAALEQLDGTFDGLMNVAGIPGTAPADLVLAVNSWRSATSPMRSSRGWCRRLGRRGLVDRGLRLATTAGRDP